MYPKNIKPENNTKSIEAASGANDEETIETMIELTDSNRKNRTSVKRV